MKRYCMINEVKKENLNDYVNLHNNPWKEMLTAIREAGAANELIYMYGNLAIIFIECEDINEFLKNLGERDVGKQWFEKVSPFLSVSQSVDEEGKVRSEAGYLEKVFDLNQQLDDVLQQF